MSSSSSVSKKHLAFAFHYIQCWDPAQAALRAGYKDSPYLHTNASKLLQKEEIRQVIDEAIEKHAMRAGEVLSRLAMMARGSVTHFITSSGDIELDTDEARENLYLVKKLKRKSGVTKSGEQWTETEIELHDPQSALVHIGRNLALFTDKFEGDVSLKAYANWREAVARSLGLGDAEEKKEGGSDEQAKNTG